MMCLASEKPFPSLRAEKTSWSQGNRGNVRPWGFQNAAVFWLDRLVDDAATVTGLSCGDGWAGWVDMGGLAES